jgi:spore coat protein A
VLGTTEIWKLVNLTEDIHPIHLHMVKFQVLDRRSFETFQYMTQGTFKFFAEASPSDARLRRPLRHILEPEDNEMMRPFEIVKG